MLMAGPAVGDDDRREVADQLVELLAVAVRGDLKRRRVGRGQSRQRSRVARGAPAGLVDVQRLLGTDPVAQVGIRARQRQRSRCLRCSTMSTLIGANSQTRRRPNRPLGRRSSSANLCPQPRHRSG